MKLQITSLSLFLIFVLTSCGDISQWRGPDRNGVYPGTDLLREWPEEGPTLELRIENIGKGLSQPVVYKNVIYITGLKSDSMDVLSAFDMEGNLLWDKVYGRAWQSSYPESRGTPSIEKNRVYLIGGMGDLVCLSVKNGDILWKRKPLEEFKGKYKGFGVVESVLLTKKAALFVTGGDVTTVVAYNKIDGELLWKSECLGGEKAYASSSLIEWKGQKIALIQTSDDLIGLDARNGDILWSYNTIQFHVKKGAGEAANTPLFYNGDIFITYGNDQPGILFSLSEDGRSIKLKWKSEILDTHHGGMVLIDGVIYASNMVNNSKGLWAAVDWETGKCYWEREWFTKGSVISADGLLYLYEERGGNLALVSPNREDLKIISTFQIKDGTGPHWAHPSIYNSMLFVRHGSVLLVYDLQE